MTDTCKSIRDRRAYRRPDWKTAARLLATGTTAAAAAATIDISEERLWRHWRRSACFRRWLSMAFDSQRDLAAMHLEGAARQALLARCQSPDGLNVNAQLLTLLSAGRISQPRRLTFAEERRAAEDARQEQECLEALDWLRRGKPDEPPR